MAKQGRIGLGGRKVLPSKNQAKRLRKVSASTNVEKAMVVSTKRRGHQPKRALRPKRGIDREKLRRLAREPSPDEPRPDGKFVFAPPKRQARLEAAKMKD